MAGVSPNFISNLQFVTTFVDPYVQSVTRSCRDNFAHEDAKELVPLAELLQSNAEILECDDYQDKLLPLVVDWFSREFFTWFQEPQCESCSQDLRISHRDTNAEKKVVEHYVCSSDNCTFNYEFIRHNEPAILLRTRRGRCGEWASCFHVILRALDYDSRIVYSTSDHVWNEIWSSAKNRWIHVDPCENVVDQPLLYEAGWKQELSYCLAFNQYDVLDVTPRYTIDFCRTKRKRNLVDEDWLSNYLNDVSNKLLQLAPSDELKQLVLDRRAKDVVHLLAISKQPQAIPDKSQLRGRKTGDIQWRIKRGEYSPSAKNSYCIKVEPRDPEKAFSECDPLFELMYNCDKNIYEGKNLGENCNKKGWASMTFEYQNLDYKYERDWKTSYVARYETCPYDTVGKVTWRFDLSKLDVSDLDRIEILVVGKEYPNTSLYIELICYQDVDGKPSVSHNIKLNETITLTKEQLGQETKHLDLTATLSGGDIDDEVSWQKPQLFRQTRGLNANDWALSVKLF